jgi:hypothetical protein
MRSMTKSCLSMLAAFFFFAALGAPAFAKKSQLPKSAKELSKSEIIAALGGKRVFWSNAIQGGIVQSGYETFAKDMKTSTATGRQKPNFRWTMVSRFSFRGNILCYASKTPEAKIFTPSPPICVKVMRDGKVFYLVKPSGKTIITLSLVN